MAVPRWMTVSARWFAAGSAGLLAALVRLIIVWVLTLLVAAAPLMGWTTLEEARTARTEGWHGTLTVRHCDRPYGDGGVWRCVGRFRSDDSEHTVANVEIERAERVELIEGWVSPDGNRLHLDPVLAPTWVIVLLAVITILIGLIGLGYSIVTAMRWALIVGGAIMDGW